MGWAPGWDGFGESVLTDESLDHFLDLTFLFLSLFLSQMNWVSITGQVRGEAVVSKRSQRRILAFLVGWGEGHSMTSGAVGGF